MKTMFRTGALAFEDGETGFDVYLFGDDGNYLRAWFSGYEAFDVLRALCEVILPLVRRKIESLKKRIKDLQKNLELYKQRGRDTKEVEAKLNEANSELEVISDILLSLGSLERRLERLFKEGEVSEV
ncbi:MAG: hypothetical protein QXT64_04800 [Desulfurococcaceae archaeon]